MSLHLFFSNDPDTLCTEFWGRFDAAWRTPLEPPVLLIPNRSVETYLRLWISRNCGVVMGLEGQFMEEYLWELYVALSGRGLDKPTLVNGELLFLMLLQVMRSAGPVDTDPRMRMLRQYLDSAGPSGRLRRSIRVATSLSGLFLEYEYSRPDLYDSTGTRRFEGILNYWPDRDYFTADQSSGSAMEQWQRALYELIFSDHGVISALKTGTGRDYTTLPRALAGKNLREPGSANCFDRPIFIYGMSGMSLFHRQTLITLSEDMDIHVFTLNPCSEFWEDVETVRRRARHGGSNGSERNRLVLDQAQWQRFNTEAWETQSLIESAEDNRLLQLWGHSGRENITLWCQAADYAFEDRYIAPTGSSLLDRIKRSLLFRLQSDPERESGTQDDSVVVFEAPGIRREVENARDFVLEALRTDPTLTPSDIGIFITDARTYRCAIYEVFDAVAPDHPLHIPWQFCDEAGATSRFGAALQRMLDLAGSDFSRSRVFEALSDPLIASAIGVEAVELDEWKRWADALAISHGMSAEHRRELGECNPSDQHTWQRAFHRLLTGHIGDQDMVMQPDAPENPDIIVRPYRDMASMDEQRCARFIRTVEALFRDLRCLGTGPDWNRAVHSLERLIDVWIAVAPEYGSEGFVRDTYLGKLNSLRIRDTLAKESFNREEFLALARSIAQTGASYGNPHPVGKLSVSTIRRSCPIPFRIVYIMGLNQGLFPGSADQDTMDLRTWKYVPGDQRPLWRNQYAFLELLLCARRRLVISYQSLDVARDEPLLPCSTVCELISFVDSALLAPRTPFRTDRIRLVPEEQKRDPCVTGAGNVPPSFTIEVTGNEPATVAPAIRAPDSAEGAPAVDISIDQMRNFLINPIDCTLKRNLDIRDEEGSGEDVDDTEPFASDGLGLWGITKAHADLVCDCTLERITTGSPPISQEEIRSLFDQVYDSALIDGRMPEGVLSHIDRQQILESARALAQGIIAGCDTYAGWQYHPRASLCGGGLLRLRRGFKLPLDNERYAGIRGGPIRMVCAGDTRVIVEVLASRALTVTKGVTTVYRRSSLLRPILYSLAYAAAHHVPAPPVHLFAMTKNHAGAHILLCPETDPRTARDYLQGLVSDMLDTQRAHDYLPFDAVDELWEKLPPDPQARITISRWIEERDQDPFRMAAPDSEALRVATPAVPADAAALIRKRFNVFFNIGGSA